jgi:hypothetical protein
MASSFATVHEPAFAFVVEAAWARGASISVNNAIAAAVEASAPAPTLPAMNVDPRSRSNFMVAP